MRMCTFIYVCALCFYAFVSTRRCICVCVCMCVCVCICACVFVRLYMYACVLCECALVCVCVYMRSYAFVCAWAFVCTCLFVRVYVRLWVYAYVCARVQPRCKSFNWSSPATAASPCYRCFFVRGGVIPIQGHLSPNGTLR